MDHESHMTIKGLENSFVVFCCEMGYFSSQEKKREKKKSEENPGEIDCTLFSCGSFTAVRSTACARQDQLYHYCHTCPTKAKYCGEPDSSEKEKDIFT